MEKSVVIFMRLLIIFLFTVHFANAQNKSVTIKTGTGTGGGTSSKVRFDITSFGAVASNSIDNRAAIQAAIDACHANGGGKVIIPASTLPYRSSKLVGYADVSIIGEGYMSSKLKSHTADTLIVIYNQVNGNTTNYLANTLLKDLTLEAGGVGTVGLYLFGAANFVIESVYFNTFTLKGLLLRNSIVGSIRDCKFTGGQYGLFAYADGTGINASTALKVEGNCVFNFCSKWAMDISGGGQFEVTGADCENNGTINDTASGVLSYHDNRWPMGVNWRGGWFEQNYGTPISITNNSTGNFSNYPANVTHSIIGLLDLGYAGSLTKRNIYLSGSNQKLGIINSSITGAINNIIVSGTNSNVNLWNVTNDAGNTNLTRNGGSITTN